MPAATSNTDTILSNEIASPSQIIPIAAVVAAPVPVHTADPTGRYSSDHASPAKLTAAKTSNDRLGHSLLNPARSLQRDCPARLHKPGHNQDHPRHAGLLSHC